MKTRKMIRKNRGQGMTEYIIIVALIAIAAIGVITVFGDNIRALFTASADSLASDVDVTVNASKVKDSMKKKNIKNFSEGNH